MNTDIRISPGEFSKCSHEKADPLESPRHPGVPGLLQTTSDSFLSSPRLRLSSQILYLFYDDKI